MKILRTEVVKSTEILKTRGGTLHEQGLLLRMSMYLRPPDFLYVESISVRKAFSPVVDLHFALRPEA